MLDIYQRPFFIRVLVPTGDPDGLRIVEKSNWPGVGVVFNRTNYREVVSRSEFDRTGVYVLVGTNAWILWSSPFSMSPFRSSSS